MRVVVIDRPDRANAIDLETAEALAATFDELERDDDTWAVVLTGAGERVFSAGMDLKAVARGPGRPINGVAGGFAGLVRRDFPKPIVAAVNGAAMGGGFEIVLACDLVVAAEHARFGLPEVTRGLMAASGGAVRLPQRLPWPVAMELLLLGDPIDAQRALELQLVNRVVPGPEVVTAAVELAERLAANGPLAVQASKRVAARRSPTARPRAGSSTPSSPPPSPGARTRRGRPGREREARARMERPMSATAAKPVPYDPLSYLRANAAVRGDALAVHDEGEELSFDALLRAVLSLAADLRERGVEPGDVVAVALPNVWRYVALEIAVPAVGAVLLPLPISLGRLETESAIERSGASLVIGERDADELETDGDPGDGPFAEPDPDRVVQIALTSGTTGRSKLASLTARLKQLTFEGFTTRLGLGPDDRMLPLSPITQGAGEMCLYALRTGAALVMSHHARFDAERSLALAERTRTTVLGGVPTMIARMLHSPALADTDLSHLRATISAGAPLPGDRRPRVGGAHRQPDLQLLRGDGRRPARRAEPRRPGREALDHGRPPARPRRAADLRPRRQRRRARARRARSACAGRSCSRNTGARTRPRTPTTAGRTSATSAGSTKTGTCTSRGA